MEKTNLYDFKAVEKKWREFWEKEGIYKFNPKSKSEPFIVDTPPPTISGKMHIGHAFSYTQQDFVVRYHRMKGENVFYPFGTDDNGLPTEKLVEKLKKVRSTTMKRNEFVELCQKTIKEIRDDFINDWKIVGMSCDFSNVYSTIDPHCMRTSQKSFIDLFNKKLVYKERESKLNYVKVEVEGGDSITFATTRPELMMACIAISVHPDDKRYKKLIGKKAIIPFSNVKVPIIADDFSKIEFGTGAVYWCPYGDINDLQFVRKHPELKVVHIMNRDGKLNENAGKYNGMNVKEAREAVLKDWQEIGALVKQDPLKQVVNVHERCGTEIEILNTNQWFVRILENKKKFIDAGNEVSWRPAHMKLRFENWVQNLQWDWCISRQRHFGVPFPVWKCNNCNELIVADEKDLPVDPLLNKPKKKCKCGSNDFEGETDVMDTWATSSVTPQIILNWAQDNFYKFDFEKMFPCSLRPQAHDIIRTWAFYTIVKSVYHNHSIPWKNIVISGHVLDPKGEAMHKSKGNAVEPVEVLSKYSVDALRFWSSSSKLGDDLRYLEKDLATGEKTVTKLLNASKFAFIHLNDFKNIKPKKIEVMDRWILSKMNNLVKECTEAFDNYEYSKVKSNVENFFWHTFCDNYLEIVKDRLYNPDKRGKEARESAQYTVYNILLNIVKIFAPIMPFVTEEIYHIYFKNYCNEISVHLLEWPKFDKNLVDESSEKIGDKAVEVIGLVRKEKVKIGKSLKEPIKVLTCDSTLKNVESDLKAVTQAHNVNYGEEFNIKF